MTPKIKIDEADHRVVEFRAAVNRLTEMRKQHTAKSKEETKLADARARARRDSINPTELEAAQLVGETAASERLPIADELRGVRHEIEVLDIAIGKQREIVERCRAGFSKHVAEQNRDTHLRIARRISRAVRELAEANEEEIIFFEALLDAGVGSIRYPSLRINHIGTASDPQSGANFHRNEVSRVAPEALH